MVKLRHNGEASGYEEYISGWVQIFFPYLLDGGRGHKDTNNSDKTNTKVRQWNEMYFEGPEPNEFPPIESYAPCDWNYFGTKYDLEFHAGISGVIQDSNTGALSPTIGWYVTHTLPKPNAVRIEEIEKEMDDLLLGHKERVSNNKKSAVSEDDEEYLAARNRFRELHEELEKLKWGQHDDGL